MNSLNSTNVEMFTARFFSACTNLKHEHLAELSPSQLRCLLPCACRIFERVSSTSADVNAVNCLIPFTNLFNLGEIARSSADIAAFKQSVVSRKRFHDQFKPPSFTATDFEQGELISRLNIVYDTLFCSWCVKNKNEKTCCALCEYKKEIVNVECIFDEVSDITCLIVAETSGSFEFNTLITNVLHSKQGVQHILKILFNMPCLLFKLVKILLHLSVSECALFEKNRFILLKQLCAISSFATSYIIEYSLSNQLYIHILFSVVSDKDIVNLFMALVLDKKKRNWLIYFLQTNSDESMEKQAFNTFRSRLCTLAYNWTPASHILTLYCALKSCLNLKLNSNEIDMVVTVISRCEKKELGICLLLLCPSIINEHESLILSFLRSLIETKNETFRLIALYCHTIRIQELNDTVSRILEFPCTVKSNNITKVTNFMNKDSLLDSFVASQGTALSVTMSLCANTTGSLPIYYLIQIFESKDYKATEGESEKIAHWIWNQILNTVLPLHPACIKLINSYVKALFTKENCFNHPIHLERLHELFNNENFDQMLTPKILALFYLLLYEEKSIESSSPGFYKYPAEVFDVIPIGFFLEKSSAFEYNLIYPSLVRLATKIFPDLLMAECRIYSHDIRFFENSPVKTFDLAIYLMKHTELTTDFHYWLKLIWSKTYTAFGQRLSLETAKIVLNNSTLKYAEIVTDPLILMKVDIDVFRNVPLVEVFLLVIQEFLIAAENHIQRVATVSKTDKAVEGQGLKRPNTDFKRLIPCTHCAVVHILLEVLSVARKKFDTIVCCALQNVIFAFLHKLFISDINLARLVHFQTYDCELIPLVVKEVPSIHVCIDSIPQILSQAEMDKQVFGLKLASCLAKQYPLPQMFIMARLILNVTATIAQVYTNNEATQFFNEAAPCILTLCKVFPPLLEDGISLLQEMAQLAGGPKVMKEFSLAALL